MAKMTPSSSSALTLLGFLLVFSVVQAQPLFANVSSEPMATHSRLAMEKAWDDFKLRRWFCVDIDDESTATWILSEQDGLRAHSAILERFSIKSFIWADDINETTMYYVPSCPAIMNMYVRRMESEKELLELDRDLIDDLRRGRREVTRVRKKMVGVDGSQNFSVSGHILKDYWNFEVDAVEGFGSLESEFPDEKEEGMCKIDFAVVAEIGGFGADENEFEKLRSFLGPDHANNLRIETGGRAIFRDVPVTMLYSVYFFC